MDSRLRDRWLAHVEQELARAGLKNGAARTAVVELLARQGQCLLGVGEITRLLRREGTASSASVYRALDELLALGLVYRLDGPDGTTCYEIADPGQRRHHHIVNERTGEMSPFTDAALDQAIEAAARSRGLSLTGHEVTLRGIPVDGRG